MPQSVDDIAASLSLSVTTIRLVLLGKARQYRISRKTERRVREYIDAHGYQINHSARSLRLKRTDTLALIVPRLSNHYFAYLTELLERRCREANLQLVVSCCYDNHETQMQLIDNFHQRNVDGLFLVPGSLEVARKATAMFEQKLVLLDRDFGDSAYSVVVSDNEQAGFELTQALIGFCQKNRRTTTFLLLAGNPFMPSIDARCQGFKRALKDAGIPRKNYRICTAPRNGFQEGAEVMAEYLRTNGALSEVVVSSSIPLFEGALESVRRAQGSVAREQILATFDDNTMLDFLPNPVCSMRQDYQGMVDSAFCEMQKHLHGDASVARYISPLTLIARNM